jgi:hypothetical protein
MFRGYPAERLALLVRMMMSADRDALTRSVAAAKAPLCSRYVVGGPAVLGERPCTPGSYLARRAIAGGEDVAAVLVLALHDHVGRL